MATVPRRLSEKVTFFQGHVERFAANAEALGLTPEEVADLQAKTDAARATMTAQYEAQGAALAATTANTLAMEAMATAGAAILKKIRSTAAATNDELVYTLAAIPLPAEPSPIGAPGTPDRLVTTLQPDGSLLLKWDCQHPRGSTGTVYQIYRRSGDEPLVYLGLVGAKRFVDTTIPKGATTLMYTIQAVRSTKVGQSAIFAVKFGSNGEKLLPFSVTPKHAVAKSLAA